MTRAATAQPGTRTQGVVGRLQSASTLWGIADQGAFAATSLAVTIVLGRHSSVEDFAWFAATYSGYLFAVMIHSAFLTEPALLRLRDCSPQDLPTYASLVAGRFHHRLAVPMSGFLVVAALVAYIYSRPSLSFGLFGAAVAQPSMLRAVMRRRLLYPSGRHFRAFVGSLGYGLSATLLLALLVTLDLLSLASAWIALGIAALLSNALLPSLASAAYPPSIASVSPEGEWRRHVWHGRWAAAGALLSWAPLNLPLLFGPAVLGLAHTAILRAAASLVMPAFQVFSALSWVLVARTKTYQTIREERRALHRQTLSACGAGAIYAILLGAFAPTFLGAFFGEKYQHSATADLRILALAVPFAAAAAILTAALRARGRPDLALISSAYAVIPVLAGLVAARSLGATTATWGIAAAYVLSSVSAGMVIRTRTSPSTE